MQTGKRVLYAGFDASQYSNGQFNHSNNRLNEICAGVFSTLPEDKKCKPFSHKRDISLLNLLDSNSRHSFSITLDRDSEQDFSDNLIYSAPYLLNYFLETMPLYEFDKIELHFDGPMRKKERTFLEKQLSRFASEIIVKNYTKFFNQNNLQPPRRIRGKRNSKSAMQPVVVGLADILSNILFKKHNLSLLLHLGDNKFSKISIPTGKNKFITHTHAW